MRTIRRFVKAALKLSGPLIRPVAEPILVVVSRRTQLMGESDRKNQILSRLGILRRFLYPSGGYHPAIARLNHSTRVWVNLCESEGANLFYGTPFEPDEQRFLAGQLSPGDAFLDVGANIGQYTLIASRRVGSSGRVHAFEPASATHATLVKNLKLNGVTNVTVNNLAVSDEEGPVRLLINRESGLSSLGNTGRGEIVGTECVSSIRLDNYVEQNGIERVRFLKIDVEGFEGHVLRAAERLLESQDQLVVMCELSEKNLQPLGESRQDIVAWMRRRRYNALDIEVGTGRLTRFKDSHVNRSPSLVFAKSGVGLGRKSEHL